MLLHLESNMRSTILPLVLPISATALGFGDHPKSAHQHARRNGTADDASEACAQIKSQISSASEVIDGLGECLPRLNGGLRVTTGVFIHKLGD